MTINATVDGNWKSERDEHSDRHDLNYRYNVDLHADAELIDLPPAQLIEAVVRSVGRALEQDIIKHSKADQSDVPPRWRFQRDHESEASGGGVSSSDGVKSDHALSGRVSYQTDFEGRPMAALGLDAKPLSYSIAHDVGTSVLNLLTGEAVESSMKTQGDDISITLR